MAKNKIILNEKIICEEYLNTTIGIESLSKKYHVGKLKIKEILEKNNIELKKKGKQELKIKWKVEDWKIPKYPEKKGYHYIVIDDKTDFSSNDINNKGGYLSSYIEKEYGIKTPTLYDRRKYYMTTGNYWWEQWLSVKLIKNDEVKKCPYCDWETVDINNKSGMFETHLLKQHNINKFEYLKEYPEDKKYFQTANPQKNLQMETNRHEFVSCKICGKKLRRITTRHLISHNITKEEYITRFGDSDLVSDSYHIKQSIASTKANINSTFVKHSSKELEIIDFLKKYNVTTKSNRTILNGKELDIYIPEHNIGIEYNGLLWHSEKYGKDKNYHLDKTIKCENNNIHLIHIFEDEYLEHKDIVLSKIKQLLHLNNDLPKIHGRKCIVKPISNFEAKTFLDNNHIQGSVNSSIYLGCFYENKIIAVMTFLEEAPLKWNLNRFCTDINYHCIGVGGKLFKYFIKNFDFKEIKSFADRRWTSLIKPNLYTKLGFKLHQITKPDYHYFINTGIKRIHKFKFRKQRLLKLYPNKGLDIKMTEKEMIDELGIHRIWDCGLIKYIYINPNYKEME